MSLKSGTAFLLAVILLAVPLCVTAQTPVIRSVETTDTRIAITFDDGPHPRLTHEILEILERYKVKATFFMVGVNVRNYPESARAVLAAGHEIGNHTDTHKHLKKMDIATCEIELSGCEDALEELCEYRPHLFRPPEGALNSDIERLAEEHHDRIILWSLDTRDWECKNAHRIAERVLSQIRPGDIVLLHDYIGTNSQTPHALELILPALLERGFEPVTVSELLGGV